MKYLLVISMILIMQSCLNLIDPEDQAHYIEFYNSFDLELVSHFPAKIPNNFIYLATGRGKTTTRFELEIKISSNEKFKKLKNQFIDSTKILINSTDSCFLIVDSKEDQTTINCNNYYPILEDAISDFEVDGYVKQDSCEVALIDCKPGIFMESEYLTAKEYLPKKWKNGYSKGYSFDNTKQTIMYWLIIW